jgi:protoheme IX farnesyltransferase
MTIAIDRARASRVALGYLELTKPRIAALVVFTGVPSLLMAAGDWPSTGVAAATLSGIALAAAAAACFNNYVDRDVDGLMRRTAARPLPAGIVPPAHALALGFALSLLAVLVLLAWTTPLAAVLAVGSIVYYGAVYSVGLKRRTPQNIVIGGGAGASAPLIAWAAVTGDVGLPAVLMAAIIFFWTPPHFWALSLYRRDDYARAGIPMLPVTHGEPETRRQIVLYSIALVPVTLALAPLGAVGPLYTVPAAVLGALFLMRAVRLERSAAIADAVRLFRYSIFYLFVLFVLLTLDAAWRHLA